MISEKIGQGAQVILRGIISALIYLRVRPNHLTFLGFLMSIVVAYVFAMGSFRLAGVLLIVAGLFDMVVDHGSLFRSHHVSGADYPLRAG
jgi:hypothetical protein